MKVKSTAYALMAMLALVVGVNAADCIPKGHFKKLTACDAHIEDLKAKKIDADSITADDLEVPGFISIDESGPNPPPTPGCDCPVGIGHTPRINLEQNVVAEKNLSVNKQLCVKQQTTLCDVDIQGDAHIDGELVVDGCITSACCKNDDNLTLTVLNVPFNTFYSTGTASQSGTTVTGVGTVFTPAMVGGRIVFNYQPDTLVNGSWANIVEVVDATHLVVDRSFDVASSSFRIGYGPYTTIQEAIDTFCTGFAGYTRIEIMPGTYDEFIDIKGFLAVANNTPRDFQQGDEPLTAGTPGFQILGDSRPYINFSYANGYEYAGTSSRGREYIVTTNLPGVGPYQASIAVSFGAVGPVTNLGAQNAEPLFAPGVSGLGCVPLTNVGLTGEIALIQRGTCGFATKALNAQNAGAAAAIIWNNNPLTGIQNLGGINFDVTIPTYSISNADGLALSAAIAANPGILVSVAPVGGIYYPPLGTNYAIVNLFHPEGDRSMITVEMGLPLPVADDNILAPPVLEQPDFNSPAVGIVAGDYIALCDADILGNYARSLHMVTEVNGNTITIDPPVPDVVDGGVDITALGSNITFLPNVRLTKSFPYEPGQQPRAIMKIDGVDLSLTGLWIDQDETQPFANMQAAFETRSNLLFLANLAVTDFFNTTAGGLAYHSISSDVYLVDGYRSEFGKNLSVVGWAEGVGVSSMGMLRYGNVFVTGIIQFGSGVSIGGSIGLENFQSFGTANLFQPGGGALFLGGGGDFNGTNMSVNKLLQVTDVYGKAISMEQSQLAVSNPSVRIERIYRPANGTIAGDFGAVALSSGSLFTINRGDYLPSGEPLTPPRLASVFSDCSDSLGPFTEPQVAIFADVNGKFVTTGQLIFNNNDLDYQTVQTGQFTAPFDPASPNDVFQVTSSGDVNNVFLKQSITDGPVALDLDPAAQFGLDYLYQGKTYVLRDTDGGSTLTLPGNFFKQFGSADTDTANFTGPNAFIIFEVESSTSVVVLDSQGVAFN